MAWDVILLEEVDEWFCTLDSDTGSTVAGAIDYLEANGPATGRPMVDTVKGSKLHHLKELRPSGTSIRILFIFDPARRAVLLLAGDKAGRWKKWYDDNIPVAEVRYQRWVRESGGE
ncbi:type II toxin-antitoxin system RelE/ParE family toxin [[Mycobacterium] vasticus]|uniref:Type II toxin-antitoxin system RelE/ParE family toxin n=1 Tax=[Mycobacterium] vasticus TaxID=2875777 RepID=A0ABU5Z303_9MYCO|nr:type II toxin-antitoxin system RelE/ParE family toxin [Mycolicibacter sp. MYC017]MEB3071784.1 type II toxin-antitoxin system RelE/ParE family toxin [Mycolicibacter sp. MYC017]